MANEFKIKKGLIVTGASGGTVVDIQGSQGQLFSVTDDLSGSIFAVSDISGVPIFDVNSSGLSTFDGNVNLPDSKKILLGTGNDFQLYHDGTHGVLNNTTGNLYTSALGALMFRTSLNVTALTLDASQNAAFAGDGTFTGDVIINGGNLDLNGTAPIMKVDSSNAASGFRLNVTGLDSAADLLYRLQAAGTTVFTVIRGGNSTFSAQAFSAATSSGDASSTLTTKGYVDSLITGATIYRGTWQAGISATSTGATSSSTTLTVSAAILDAAGNTPVLVGAVVTGAGITGTVKVASVTSSTVYELDTAISATASAYIFSPIYGAPDLSGVTQTSGYYYICSEAGSATPNGAGTEPNTWDVGDWVIWNDDVGASGEWQKVDNSSVLSGVGTGQTVALWEGPSSVTDSETLGNSVMTQSGANIGIGTTSYTNSSGYSTLNINGTSGGQIAFQTAGTSKHFIWGTATDFNIYNGQAGPLILYTSATERMRIDSSGNSTFTGDITGVRGFFNSGATNVVATFTSTDGTATLQCADPTGNVEFGASGNNFVVQPAGGVAQLTVGSSSSTFAGDVTVNGGDITLGGTGRIQGVDTVSASTDATNKAYVDNAIDGTLQMVKFNRSGINSSTYTMLATVNGDNLASILKMTMTGTSGNVVFACTFDITVNHSQDIHVKSSNGDYTEVTLRITSDNNEDFSIEAKHNGSTTTTAEVCIYPLADEIVTPTTTDPGYTGAEYEHTATEGWRYGGEDNGSESSNVIIDGKVGIGTTGPNTGKLVVEGAAYSISSSGQSLGGIDLRTAANGGAGSYSAGISFGGASSGRAAISGVMSPASTDGDRQGLAFFTHGSGTGSADAAEAMRIQSDGNVGIGETSPDRKLVLDGTLGTPALEIKKNTDRIVYLGTGSSASADDNTILHLMDQNVVKINLNTVGDSYLNGGNVGIGTTSPSTRFEVAASATASVDIAHFSNSNDVVKIKHALDGVGSGRVSIFDASNNEDVRLSAQSNSWFNAGNVGIGTTLPTTALTIRKAISPTAYGEQASMIEFKSYYTGYDTETVKSAIYSGVSDQTGLQTTRGFMSFWTADFVSGGGQSLTEKMRIESNGNVGIGTTSPLGKLQVNEYTVASQGNQGVHGEVSVFADNGDESLFLGLKDSAYPNRGWAFNPVAYGINSSLQIKEHGSTAVRMTIQSGGNVGIGTTSIDASSPKLEVSGSIMSTSSSLTAAPTTASVVMDYHSPNNAGRIMAGSGGSWNKNLSLVPYGGNVGIGTASPGYELSVNGNIEAGKNVFQDISSKGGFIMRPWGADYLNTTTNIHTGAIKITLPTGAATEDDMIKFTIDIYQYSANESLSIDVGGYVYRQAGINDSWRNVTAIVNAKSATENYTVRFGDDGTNHCVWVGELNTVWNHPNVICRNFYGGFAVETEDYLNEWDISFEATSFSHVSQTQSNNFPLSSGGIDGGFLPLSAGSSYPLTGALHFGDAFNYIEKNASSDMLMVANRHITFSDVISGVVNERMRIEEGGNVGIGTTSPAGKFNSYISAARQLTHNGNGGDLSIISDNNNNPVMFIKGTGTAALLDIQGTQGQLFSVTDDLSGSIFAVSDISGVPIFDVNSSGVSYFDGNVGIGTTSPTSKLQVSGSGNESVEIKISAGTTAGNTGSISLSRTDGGGNIIQGAAFLSGGVPIGGIAGGVVGSSNTSAPAFAIQTPNSANGHIVFNPKGTEKMRIEAGGNVGIGITNPAVPLDVEGKIRSNDSNSGDYLEIFCDGSVSGDSYIENTNNNIQIKSAFATSFSTSGSVAMFIKNNQYVGIGTTNPQYKLDVNGQIRAVGIVNIGGLGVAASGALANVDINDTDANGTSTSYQPNITFKAAGVLKAQIGKLSGSTNYFTAAKNFDGPVNIIASEIHSGHTHSQEYIFGYEPANNLNTWGLNLVDGTNTANSLYLSAEGLNQNSSIWFGGYVNALLVTRISLNQTLGTWLYDCPDAGTSNVSVKWRQYNTGGYMQNMIDFEDDGDIKNINGSYGTITSDERVKENIVDATSKLDDILSLKVKNFNFIGDDKKQIGLIAQEVEEIFPSWVNTRDTRIYKTHDEDGNPLEEQGELVSGHEDGKSLKVGMEFAILTKAIQEQQEIIESLKQRIEQLEN